jgi:integrase
MRFYDAIDEFVAEKRQFQGFAATSERAYRDTLNRLAERVGNAAPHTVTAADCRAVLRAWPRAIKPNTLARKRYHMVSFFKWAMQREDLGVESNPAQRVPAPKTTPGERRKITRPEMDAMLRACRDARETRVIGLLLLGGFRSQEIRGLRGRNFERGDVIEVPAEIGKGGRAREVVVLPGLVGVVDEILATVAADECVFPAQRWRDPGFNRQHYDLRTIPGSQQALTHLVVGVAERAGIPEPWKVTAHCLRHANAQVLAEVVGVYAAQAQLGHADLRTTQGYLTRSTVDFRLQEVRNVNLGVSERTPVRSGAEIEGKATTRFELVYAALQAAG